MGLLLGILFLSLSFVFLYVVLKRPNETNEEYHATAGTYKPLDSNYVPSGKQRIIIQYKVGITGIRRDRREKLIRKFRKIEGILATFGCRIDWSALTISAQTVEAELPTHMLNELKKSLVDGPYHFDEVEVVYVEKE